MTSAISGTGTRNQDRDEFGPLPTYLELSMAMAAATAYEAASAHQSRRILPRLSIVEKAIAASIAALALYGIVLLTDGLYIKAKTELSHMLLERAFAAELRGEDAKPWPWADFTTEAEVAAPRLGKQAIVLSAGTADASAFGPIRVANTPQPGDEGTSIISADRDGHFRWLKEVKPGDEIEVTRRDGKVLTFKAGEGRIVPSDSGITPLAQGRHLVLATCWPFGATERGPLRYVVEAELVDTQATGALPATNTKPLSRAE
ncbi:class GN sortase [Rhizobium cauense]|uniref:class GN sortase n=1 Tax=Rhizobium cauense TaxID=1166683 RepID=UPI0030B89307